MSPLTWEALKNWTESDLATGLRETGVCLRTGPFVSRIQSAIPDIAEGLALLYGDYPVAAQEDFADFHVSLTRPKGVRRWLRPQVLFEFDGHRPFKPLPLDQSLPFLEWGLNWSIGNHAHNFLLIHAAAIEKNGRAAILPGSPGSGKSTLCAYLVHNGWRLLSDELALLSLTDGSITALARPISLKNESIAVIRDRLDDPVISRLSHDTGKGTVALLKAPADAVSRVDETALPAWVIFPKFVAGAETSLAARSKADSFIEVGRNAFNYSIHGKLGFDLLASLMDSCDCYDFSYSDLSEAHSVFEALEPPEPMPQDAPADTNLQ